MEYVYSKSYYGIYLGLHLKEKGFEVCIITPSTDLHKFCLTIKLNVVFISNASISDILYHPRIIDKKIREIISLIGKNNLHFSHRQFDVFCFLLVEKYSKVGHVRFYPIEFKYDSEIINVLDRLIVKQYLIFFVKKIVIYLFYNTNVDFILYKGGFFLFRIVDNFFRRNKIITMDIPNYEELKIEIIKKNHIDLEKCKNLYITQNYENYPYINKKSIIKLIEYIKTLDIAIKLHPNMEEKKIYPSKKYYPHYIPAEMLFCNVANSIISISSLALVYASNFENIKAISLLLLLDWDYPAERDQQENFLRNASSNRVIFPKSYSEFENLLLDKNL